MISKVAVKTSYAEKSRKGYFFQQGQLRSRMTGIGFLLCQAVTPSRNARSQAEYKIAVCYH